MVYLFEMPSGTQGMQSPPQPQATPASTTQMPLPDTKPEDTKPKGNFQLTAAIALLVIIVVLVVVYLFYSGGNSNSLLSELSSNKTAAGVIAIASHKVSTANHFNVSYQGVANLGISDLVLKIPIMLSYQKYYNNSRFYLDASGIPLIGNVTSTYINLANGTAYSCSLETSYNISSSAGTSSHRAVSCTPSQSGNGITSLISSYSSQVNSNSLSSNATVQILGSRQYKGQGCVFVISKGSYSKTGNATSYNVSMCLSNQYNVPLNLTLTGSSSSAIGNTIISLSLNETSIGVPLTQAEVTSLPGPIVAPQSTSINSSNTGNSNFGSGLSTGNLACAALSTNYTCSADIADPVSTSPVFSYRNGQSIEINGTFINFFISQNSGNTWNNTNITYVPAGTALNSKGIPEAPFNASDSVSVFSLASQSGGLGSLVMDLPVSSASSGSFNGTLWATYNLDNNPTVLQYTEIAHVNGKTG